MLSKLIYGIKIQLNQTTDFSFESLVACSRMENKEWVR